MDKKQLRDLEQVFPPTWAGRGGVVTGTFSFYQKAPGYLISGKAVNGWCNTVKGQTDGQCAGIVYSAAL